jgi:uncharacterized protein (DUF1697 family)
MPEMRYAAFLRGVNVAGKSLSMPALKVMLGALGFEQARTLLQSGNVVFETGKRSEREIEAFLERETEKRLKVRTEYFLRNGKELERIVEDNPFAREARADPGHLVVMFLKDAVTKQKVAELQSRIVGPEVVREAGRELYITYPAGQGRSKLTNALIEKRSTHAAPRATGIRS